MTEFFKALSKFKPRDRLKYFMVIEGEKIIYIGHDNIKGSTEIDSATYGRLRDGGLENFTWDGLKISAKPFVKPIPLEDELLAVQENGYRFLQNNPFWVKEFVETGEGIYSWRKK